MYKYRCITQTTTWLNCFLLFCSDLAVVIFPTLFADIKRPNKKSTQVPRAVGRVTYCPCPLSSFTLLYAKRGILRNKTIEDKLVFIPNDVKQTKFTLM